MTLIHGFRCVLHDNCKQTCRTHDEHFVEPCAILVGEDTFAHYGIPLPVGAGK